jgi:hypothetical protein
MKGMRMSLWHLSLQKYLAEPYNAHVLLNKKVPSFKLSGLKRDSVIQLNKLATIDKSLIEGEFGEIDPDLKKEVRRILIEIFGR